jgi:hypothetical protein
MLELDETRQMLFGVLLGFLFLLSGGYWGILRQQVGLPYLVPLRGDIARVWGVIMCVLGIMLIFVALT